MEQENVCEAGQKAGTATGQGTGDPFRGMLSYHRLRNSETDERRRNGDMGQDSRTPIESDLGRVVFSSASRRLHDKTQVFPLTSDDNIHSRLTHSMEVMSLGRSFALNICQDEQMGKTMADVSRLAFLQRDVMSLLEAICIAHDIGNPPFGHFGETAIQCFFSDLFAEIEDALAGNPYQSKQVIVRGLLEEIENRKKPDGKGGKTALSPEEKAELKEKALKELRVLMANENLKRDYTLFDGNAEGFRVLTKLQYLNDLYGLNLTCATLAAFLKYPNLGAIDSSLPMHKHGVFSTEEKEFREIMEYCRLSPVSETAYHRHPLAYLMEASDSICYLIMDIEDAVSKGWMDYPQLLLKLKKYAPVPEAMEKIIEKAAEHYQDRDPNKKKIVQLRTELMAYLVNLATDNFTHSFRQICDGTYEKELIFDDKNGIAKALTDLNVKEVYAHREIETLEITGNAVISGILSYYIRYLFHPNKDYRKRAKHLLSQAIFQTTLQEHLDAETGKPGEKKAWEEYEEFDPATFTVEERLRIVRDFVAGMTDRYALSHYRQLTGQQI